MKKLIIIIATLCAAQAFAAEKVPLQCFEVLPELGRVVDRFRAGMPLNFVYEFMDEKGTSHKEAALSHLFFTTAFINRAAAIEDIESIWLYQCAEFVEGR